MAKLGPERACIIEYEKMHADMPGCLARLAKFLGPEAEATLARDGDEIQRLLGFDVMKAEGASKHILRNGKAGGWRAHFSPTDEKRLACMIDARLPVDSESVVGLDQSAGAWREELLAKAAE